MNKTVLYLTAAATLAGAAAVARADALAEARALLKTKKYAQVDQKLEELLTAKPPHLEALKVSLAAAVADHRYVTANHRVTALLKATDNADLDMVFQGAQLAHRAAEFREALGRFLYYVQHQKARSEKLRRAMHYLLARGAYPDVYERYVALYGADRTAWTYGLKLLDRVLSAAEPRRVRRAANLLMKAFPAPREILTVQERLRRAVGTAALGGTAKARHALALALAVAGRPAGYGCLYGMFWDGSRHVAVADLVTALLRAQEVAGRPLPMVHAYNSDRDMLDWFDRAGSIEDKAVRLRLGRKFLAAEKAYLDSKNPRDYFRYLHQIVEMPQVFHVAGDELISDAEIVKKFQAARDKLADEARSLHGVLGEIQEEFLSGNDKARTAFLACHLDIAGVGDFRDLLELTGGEDVDRHLAAATRGRTFQEAIGYGVEAARAYNKLAEPHHQAVVDAREALEQARSRSKDQAGAVAKASKAAKASAAKAAKTKDKGDRKQAAEDKQALADAQKALHDAQQDVKSAEGELKKAEARFAAATRGHGRKVLAAFRDYMTCYPATFDYRDRVVPYLIRSPLVDRDEKLALVKEVVAKAGSTGRLRGLLKEMARDESTWRGRKDFEAVRARADNVKAKGNDVLMRVCARLHEIPRHGAERPKEVKALVEEALFHVKGRLMDLPPEDPRGVLIARIHHRHLDLMGGSLGGKLWSARVGLDAEWARMAEQTAEDSPRGRLHELVKRYAALLGRGRTGSPAVWRHLARCANAEDDANSVFEGLYDKMGWDNAINYLYRQGETYCPKHRAHWLAEMGKVAAMRGFAFSDDRLVRELVKDAYYWCNHDRKAPLPLLKALWAHHTSGRDLAASGDPWFEARVYGMYRRSGHAEQAAAMLANHVKQVARRPLPDQVAFYGRLYETTAPPDDPNAELQPGRYHHTLFKAVIPLYAKAAADGALPATDVYEPFISHLTHLAGLTGRTDEEKARLPLRDDANAALQVLAGARMGGAGYRGDWRSYLRLLDAAIFRTLAAGDLDRLSRQLIYYAGQMHLHGHDVRWDQNLRSRIEPMARALIQRDADEVAYAFITAVDRLQTVPEKVRGQMMVLKSQAARAIAGLIGVPKSDPTYALHLAAQVLSLGDEGRAWRLTKPKIELLQKSWESLDPRYVAWCVDQLRLHKRHKEALTLAFTVLLREKDLAADIAARVLLTRGDIYRDMENYRAAIVEYQSLRSNTRYNDTEPGNKALYRLIDLYIEIADYPSAEAILERLVESEDVRVRAEAHYLFAKMAYQQEQWRESAEYVRKVRRLVPDHVEAGFLDGRLKLKVTRGLVSPEVEVGDPRLRRMVIPGRVLTMKLEDTNLAIAKAGKAVPVVVRTSEGGDEEHVKLLQSSAKRTLFVGEIPTALGKAQQGNHHLEVVGEDVVSYMIEPAYQKANELHYDPKILVVRSDAALDAGSGEILTEEEREQRALEQKMAAPRREETSRRFDVMRRETIVRPGSPIHVQVVDLDQDVSDARDKVFVRVTTSYGDAIDSFALTETGEHTGRFRAEVPTSIPLPKALASDSAEGRDVGCLINTTRGQAWSSLADGEKPKWVEVDTMTSHRAKRVAVRPDQVGRHARLRLLGMLAGDYIELAAWPRREDRQAGGVTVTHAWGASGDTLTRMRQQMKLKRSGSYRQAGCTLERSSSPYKRRHGGVVWRLQGKFWLREARTLELKFDHPGQRKGRGAQDAFLLIDGRVVLGGHVDRHSLDRSRQLRLTAGGHDLDLWVCDDRAGSKLAVACRDADGNFVPLPAAWFSVEQTPELADYLRPKGTIETVGGRFVATLEDPIRLRKIRWVFEDFTGNAVSADEIRITDADGKTVIPVEKDFSAGKANAVLEIAPGDQITVTYRDVQRASSPTPELTASLNASYTNGAVEINYEQVTDARGRSGDRRIQLQRALRFRIGDQLLVMVRDADEDMTAKRDTVPVTVRTSGGETLQLEALEMAHGGRGSARHSGVFGAVLRTGKKTQGETIRVRPGDDIIVSYVDRENTDPGVAVERTYTVSEAGTGSPIPLVYRTRVVLSEDTSTEAELKKSRIRVRTKAEGELVIYKETVVAEAPPAEAPPADAADANVACSVNAPLMFEVTYPMLALHAGSAYEATVVAESELAAAAEARRKPTELTVPMRLGSALAAGRKAGYDVQSDQVRRSSQLAGSMQVSPELEQGIFAAAVRLQLGSPGDKPDAAVAGPSARRGRRQVPTLVVCGSDVVRIRFKDVQSGEVIERKVRLLSDGRLELLDATYTVRRNAIHLGEKFFVRVTDLDQDTTGRRDAVALALRSGSGDRLTVNLAETLPHSGVFTGSVEPNYAGEKADAPNAIDPNDELISVAFGDRVSFEYTDEASLSADGPRTVADEGSIFFGADAEVSLFTKRFTDPEMAVKTRFLMAEALFEVAKEYRKLGETARADAELARGKRVLEEAMRDYPETSLAAQGRFLLGNLAQELEKYREAIGIYAHVITVWPDSQFAPRAQLKKAICHEKLDEYDQACEEYVKLTYVYPDSPLVADATVRLANYYYKRKRYDTAGRVFYKFQQRQPTHRLAAKALFLSGQCYYKMEDYKTAARRFDLLVREYTDDPRVRGEAMYWLGEAYFNDREYAEAYQAFKKLTWDYPESRWAQAARGRLTERVFARMD
jgi:TolA-binding protein